MILGKQLAPAEAEQTVKTYHCTSFRSRLLSIAAEGYLEVTNKRVVFQATGGDSLIHSEVPIEEVSGISLFRGNYFSLKHFIVAVLLSLVLSSLATLLLTVIYGFSSDEGSLAFMGWLAAVATGAASLALAKDQIWRPVLAAVSAAAFGVIGGFSLLGGGMLRYGSGLGLLFAVVVSGYALICLIGYATRRTMSLAINAKGGSNTPIAIAGAGRGGALYSTAALALEAEPAGDAEVIMKELGALIMDIQQRGDFGMEKWRANPSA